MNDLLIVEQVFPQHDVLYPWHGPFTYSLRCVLCLNEEPHNAEQHAILSTGIEVQS